MKEKEEILDNQNDSVLKVIERPENEIKKEEKINEKEATSNDEKEKSKKWGIILIISIILLILVLVFSTIFALVNISSIKIIKGILINQIDVSNMAKEEAKNMIQEIYSKKEENEIYLKYGEFEATTTYKALEVQYLIDKAIEEAYQIGRKGNLFRDNFEIIKTWLKGKQIKLEVTIDNEMLQQVVQNINNSIKEAIVQPSYYIENGKLIITSGKEGLKAEEEKLFQQIYKIVKGETEAPTIDIPMINASPNEIDIEAIHKEVYKEVQDAYYTKEPFTIYPESDGIDFDKENAKLLLAEPKEQYEIQLVITKPRLTTKQIGTEAFPDLLATFSTKYQASNKNRTTNLILAANKINGTVLLPGQEFSYNKTVGERTIAAGFKEAAVFNAGRVENGLGGGICQISTTLYDAVVMANLDITQRRNHQFVTSYVPAGKDATVVWGSQDFKFKNTRKYPIRIAATVQGGVATVQVWGVKEEIEYDITIQTKKTATIPFTTQYVPDPSLPASQEKVVQNGSNGSKVEAYKVTKLNGQVISTTLLSKDTYNAMKKIVHVGTGQ